MTVCPLQASGAVELYFYAELDAVEHARVERHLIVCDECRRTLEELRTIRAALAVRPQIAAPESGDWTRFMVRLDDAVRGELHPRSARNSGVSAVRPHLGYLAMAALLVLVTVSVLLAWRASDRGFDRLLTPPQGAGASSVPTTAVETPRQAAAPDPAFVALSERHFERAKLVVLGLATKDPADPTRADWDYERALADTLLSDTRLYRLAAEERGLTSLARVMQDLELVLLQTAMSDKSDASSLEQLQRLIRRRDLVTKMEVVTTTAGI